MKVEDVLKKKGRRVFTIKQTETIAALSRALRENRVGAYVVSHNGKSIDGIISERDIAYSLAERRGELHLLPVAALMTKHVVTCSPDDSVQAAASIMHDRRIRHLPVKENGELVGIISLRDILEVRLEQIERRSVALKAFVLTSD